MFHIWLFVISVTTVTGKTLPVKNPLYTERVVVGHFHHQLRQRRSEDTNPTLFPDKIRLQFTLKGSLVDLNLTKKEHRNRHVIQDGRHTYRASESIIHQDHAIYQNKTLGAAITMRCPYFDYLDCEVHGSFIHKNGLFRIEPTGDEMKTVYEINQISPKQNKVVSVADSVAKSALGVLENKIKDFKKENLHTANLTLKTRSKRDATIPGTYVVEFALWFDDTVWRQFLEVNDQNTTAAEADINVFAVGIMNEADVRFQNMQGKINEYKLRFNFDCNAMLNYVRICKLPSQCLWSSNNVVNGKIEADTDDVITSFINEIGSVPIGYDTIAGLTLYECRDTKSSHDEVIGIYFYQDTMCTPSGSRLVASIVNAQNGAAGFNLVHMVAHQLGAKGDSVDANCTESNNFITSNKWSITTDASLATNPFTWSYCALQRLKNYIGRKDISCLTQNNFAAGLYAQYHTEALLGEVYDLDKQCSLETGTKNSVWCGTRQENICYKGLDCTDPSAGNACVSSAVFPYSGTRCDVPNTYPVKFCFNGTCVNGPTSKYYSCDLQTKCVND